jgi:hypothetical protein
LVPPIFTVVLIIWLVVFIVIALFVVSIGQLTQRQDFTFLSEVIMPKEAEYMFLYTLFGYLWMNAFIIGIG